MRPQAEQDADGILHVQVHRLLQALDRGILSEGQVVEQLREDVTTNWHDWVRWCGKEDQRKAGMQ